MDSASATPLPLSNPSGNGDAPSLEGNFAATVVKRVMAFRPSNPLPGVTNFNTFGQLLKKEAPKLLDVRTYSKPASAEQALGRVKANLSFFRVTYTAVFAGIVVMFILSNLPLFLATVMLAALWAAFLSQPPDHVLKLGSVELRRNEKTVILTSLTVLVVIFGGLLSSLLYIIVLTGFVVGVHGSFKEPVVLDALEVLEQEGESIVKGDMV